MSRIAVAPVDAGIAHHGVLLGEQRAHLILAVGTYAAHIVIRHTADWDIILLVGINQIITEMLAHKEMLVKLELRRNSQVDHGILPTVFVFSISILIDGVWITQLIIIVGIFCQGLVQIGLVADVEIAVAQHAIGIGVWTQHRTLDISQERRSGRSTLVIALRCAIVADIAGLVGKRGIKCHAKLISQSNICIESDVQAVLVVKLQWSLIGHIAQAQIVVCHIITTLYIDIIVLGEGITIHPILPVGIVMILRIIIIGRVLVEELEVGNLGAGGGQQIRSIALILRRIHHIVELRLGGNAR